MTTPGTLAAGHRKNDSHTNWKSFFQLNSFDTDRMKYEICWWIRDINDLTQPGPFMVEY